MSEQNSRIGVLGLGVMGRNLALNIAGHGWAVSGFDKDPKKTRRFAVDGAGATRGFESFAPFVGSLQTPRTILLLVPAGAPVDEVIRELLPLLEPGDLLIDGGNSFFRDTERRGDALAARKVRFMGLGISGGEAGARHGPSLMPGGAKDDYERLQPLLEAIAAQVDGSPCVTYLGPGAAGHYVKMVHNGIEYAAMELIAETYDLMRRGLGLADEEMSATYDRWNEGELRSYLLGITARVLRAVDEKTGQRLVHVIVDEAGQKGTGRWSSQDAMELGVPVPNVDAAVMMRNLSALRGVRQATRQLLAEPTHLFEQDRQRFLERLRRALHLGLLLSYAQGMAQLGAASSAYRFELPLAEVARIWRGGCIIRAALLEGIRAAYRATPDLSHLLLDPYTSRVVVDLLPDLRFIASDAASRGIPVPGLMAALSYLDGLRSTRLPADLLQAQRDYFGAHGYARIDAEGTFHSTWVLKPEGERAH